MRYLRGAVPKGELEAILGVSERHARRIVEPLLKRGLLTSESKAAPYTISFPLEASEILFPGLFQAPANPGVAATFGTPPDDGMNQSAGDSNEAPSPS